MELTQEIRDRHWLVRFVPAAGLLVLALWSLRRGKRVRGVVAGLGAVALGYRVMNNPGDAVEHTETDYDRTAVSEPAQLRCAICGDPIVTGESRRPNENDETVHEGCLEASA